LEENTNIEPSTKHGIEAARLYAFTLPSSPLDDTLSHVLPQRMNNPRCNHALSKVRFAKVYPMKPHYLPIK
jgi:hypothetical protein